MSNGSSEQVRAVALERYIGPALRAGKAQFSVAVKDLMQDLVAQGFPPGNTPQVCSALQKKSYLREHGIEIGHVEGPPKKMSTTVVFHFRTASPGVQSVGENNPDRVKQIERELEDPSAKAKRLTEKLRGLLKEELSEYGGGEAFLRWVRSEDEDAA